MALSSIGHTWVYSERSWLSRPGSSARTAKSSRARAMPSRSPLLRPSPAACSSAKQVLQAGASCFGFLSMLAGTGLLSYGPGCSRLRLHSKSPPLKTDPLLNSKLRLISISKVTSNEAKVSCCICTHLKSPIAGRQVCSSSTTVRGSLRAGCRRAEGDCDARLLTQNGACCPQRLLRTAWPCSFSKGI